MTDIEKKSQDYVYDLCSHCRDCGHPYGLDKPCRHIVDAKHGFKDGYKKGFSDACELVKSDTQFYDMLKTLEKTEIGELLKYAFEAGCKAGGLK